MQFTLGAILVLAVCSTASRQSLLVGSDHPVSKVIKLLEGLSAKVKFEGKAEALTYQKFEYWCASSKKELGKAIAEEEGKIEQLTDKIGAGSKQNETLTEQISELVEQIRELQVSNLNAQRGRRKANGVYLAAESDYTTTITSIKQCITALEDSQGGSLAQVFKKPHVQAALALAEAVATPSQRADVSAMIQASKADPRPVQRAAGDRDRHVQTYAFKSNNVVELLKKLQKEFEDSLVKATTEETNSVNNFALAKQARDEEISAAEDSRDTKTTEKAGVEQSLNQDRADLTDTQDDHTADTTSLKDTKKSCTIKAGEWSDRVAVRKQELEAMDAAIKILAKATGVQTEAPENPGMPTRPIDAQAFLQVSDPKAKAVNLLKETAKRTHSKALERMAQELSLHLDDPFKQVNNMVEKMIFRLIDEQRDEDEHKLWCDQELEKNNVSKDKKTDKVTELELKISQDEATVQSLTGELSDAQSFVSEIDAFMKEATEVRNIGKKENKQAIEESQLAQSSLSEAIAVLEAFYKQSGMVAKEPYEFIQIDRAPMNLPDAPSNWDSGYTGVSNPQEQPHGIITVLQSTSSEFATMEADTRSQEATDDADYLNEMKDQKIEKARRNKELQMKTEEKRRLVDKISSNKMKRKTVAGELESVNTYLQDLQPACVDGDSTYEARKQNRTAETNALRQAQVILKDAFKQASFRQTTKNLRSHM